MIEWLISTMIIFSLLFPAQHFTQKKICSSKQDQKGFEMVTKSLSDQNSLPVWICQKEVSPSSIGYKSPSRSIRFQLRRINETAK